jgi:hypothetical protein
MMGWKKIPRLIRRGIILFALMIVLYIILDQIKYSGDCSGFLCFSINSSYLLVLPGIFSLFLILSSLGNYSTFLTNYSDIYLIEAASFLISFVIYYLIWSLIVFIYHLDERAIVRKKIKKLSKKGIEMSEDIIKIGKRLRKLKRFR